MPLLIFIKNSELNFKKNFFWNEKSYGIIQINHSSPHFQKGIIFYENLRSREKFFKLIQAKKIPYQTSKIFKSIYALILYLFHKNPSYFV